MDESQINYAPSVNDTRAIALSGLFTAGYAAFLYK